MVARVVRVHKVAGSNPVTPTLAAPQVIDLRGSPFSETRGSRRIIPHMTSEPRKRNVGNAMPCAVDHMEALRAAYAALNRNDIPGFVANFDPQIERIEPAAVPEDGIFRGLEAVKTHVSKARATWAEGGCEPQRFIVAGDRIVVLELPRADREPHRAPHEHASALDRNGGA